MLLAKEAAALTAIGKLQKRYPYAATLLTYVTLERCLKLYLLENRRTLTNADVDLNRRFKDKKKKVHTLADDRHLDDERFVSEFLKILPLGSLEDLFRLRHEPKYSTHRNDVVHSNLYLSEQRGLNKKKRNARNADYLKTAKADLIDASRLFRREIVEVRGELVFKRSRVTER